MGLTLALLISVFAGIINGSFALPTKHIKIWQFENIWLLFVIWAFLIFPWLFMYLQTTDLLQVYAQTPANIITVMVIFGVLFGIGQMCFAMALNTIGLGLGFVINIGLGTALGSIVPLVAQHPQEIPTKFGLITILAVICIVAGLIFYYVAGKKRDEQQSGVKHVQAGKFKLGLVLAIIAGLSSAGQNFAFSMSAHMQQIALNIGMNKLAAATVIWPGFLLLGAIPYALYMLAMHRKNKSFANYRQGKFGKNYLLVVIMALCWYGSLLLYSKAAQIIGALGPVIAWPLFMVLIILTSNFWGWRHKEWDNCSVSIKKTLFAGLALLIIAIILLSYSAYLGS